MVTSRIAVRPAAGSPHPHHKVLPSRDARSLLLLRKVGDSSRELQIPAPSSRDVKRSRLNCGQFAANSRKFADFLSQDFKVPRRCHGPLGHSPWHGAHRCCWHAFSRTAGAVWRPCSRSASFRWSARSAPRSITAAPMPCAAPCRTLSIRPRSCCRRTRKASTASQLAQKASELFHVDVRSARGQQRPGHQQFSSPQQGSFNLTVSGSATVPTMFWRLIGQPQIDINTSGEVVWGIKKLNLALAFDNTGSMASTARWPRSRRPPTIS